MSIEYGRERVEIELNTIVDIKKFLVPFMRRNSLQEVKIQIINSQKESVSSFHYAYVNGVSQVNGDNRLSPFKPNFVNYIRSLWFEHGMTFYVGPCRKDEIIPVLEPVDNVVSDTRHEIESVVSSYELTLWEAEETTQIPNQEKKKSKKKKSSIPKRKKPTNVERKKRKAKNQERIHIDMMRNDMSMWHITRMLKWNGKPAPDWYIALSSKILTRVTNRGLEEYREWLFLEYTEEEFLSWLKSLETWTKWLDIGSWNTYQNECSHIFQLNEYNAWVGLTCYDPIYKWKNNFPRQAEFVWWYAQNLPFEEDSFEIITSLQVFDKISEENHGVEIAFLEALRVLKPKGILKIAPLNTLDMLYGICEIRKILWNEVQSIDIDIIWDQINIVKTKAFSQEILKRIKDRVLYWNEKWRFICHPLSFPWIHKGE
jgi:SAM-dependent methyltransferase